MPYANVNGVNLYYEDHGPRTGPTVILTPGGRNDTNGLRPIAALLSAHCRVILHDRRNCGKSGHSHRRRAFRAASLGRGDGGIAAATGRRSGLCRRWFCGYPHQPHPGGPPARGGQGRLHLGGQRGPNSAAETAPNYYGQFIAAAERGGMPAVAETEYFAQRIADNPANKDVLLAMDPAEFISVMSRWQEIYSRPNPVSDLTEEQLQSIRCPVVMFEGNTPDEVHHMSAAEAAHRLIPNSELRPSAWTHEEWDIIGQHDHTFPGIAATNRYHMKATFYAAQILEFIARVEAMEPVAVG